MTVEATVIAGGRERYRRPWALVRSASGSLVFVSAAALAYGAFFAFAAATVYWSLQERRYDLGGMVQAVWSTAHGHVLAVSGDAGRSTTVLNWHVEPFLILFAPLWRLWPSPLMLLIAQALAVASGAFPVFFLARRYMMDSRIAGAFALVYLLYPATQFNAFAIANGFHPVSFAIPLILWAIWFIEAEHVVLFGVCAMLAASTKEELPLAVGLMGVWIGVRKKRRRLGLSILVLGAAATAANFFLVIPHFAPGATSPFAGRYATVGGSPGGILRTTVTDPLSVVQTVVTAHKLAYLVLLFVPLLGLWFRELLLLLGAVPDLAVNLLSSRPEMTTIHFQYTSGITPFLIAATIIGASRVRRHRSRLVWVTIGVAVLMAAYSPAWYFAGSSLGDPRAAGALHAAKAEALSLVPRGAPVAASNELAGYLSARSTVALFPHLPEVDWVVVDSKDHTMRNAKSVRRALAALRANPKWQLIYSSTGIEVLRRRAG